MFKVSLCTNLTSAKIMYSQGGYVFSCDTVSLGSMTMYCASSYTVTEETLFTLTLASFGADASSITSYTETLSTTISDLGEPVSTTIMITVQTGPAETVFNVPTGGYQLFAMGVLLSSTVSNLGGINGTYNKANHAVNSVCHHRRCH